MTTTVNCHYYEGGVPAEVLLEHARQRRIAESRTVTIPCPGGCGGEAELEAPTVTLRDGVVICERYATCQGTCRTEVVPMGRRAARRLRTRYPLPCEEEVTPLRYYPPTGETWEAERVRVSAAIEKSGSSKGEVAARCHIHQSNMCRWLRDGRGLSPDRFASLLEFADQVERGEWMPGGHRTPAQEMAWQTRQNRDLAGKPSRRSRPKLTPEQRDESRKRAWETRRQNGQGGKMGAYKKEPKPEPFVSHVKVLSDAEAEAEFRDWGPTTPEDAQATAVLLDEVVTPPISQSSATPLGDAIILEHLERVLAAEIERLAPEQAKRVRAKVLLEAK